MKMFLLMHALYLAGGITAYLIQFVYNSKVTGKDWTRYESFKAAITSFLSWAYVIVFCIIMFFNKVTKEFSMVKGMYK